MGRCTLLGNCLTTQPELCDLILDVSLMSFSFRCLPFLMYRIIPLELSVLEYPAPAWPDPLLFTVLGYACLIRFARFKPSLWSQSNRPLMPSAPTPSTSSVESCLFKLVCFKSWAVICCFVYFFILIHSEDPAQIECFYPSIFNIPAFASFSPLNRNFNKFPIVLNLCSLQSILT